MFEFMAYGPDKLQAFMLVNLRVGGLLLSAPILGRASIPIMIKLGLVITLTVLMMPLVMNYPLPAVGSLADLLALGFTEVLIGVVIGLLLKLIFFSAQAAGSLVGFQSGLSIANVIDPSTQKEVNMIGQFWFLIASVIYLAINGHHLAISGLADSFQLIPLGQASFGGQALDLLIRLSGTVYTLALKFAAPILIAVFLVDVSMGVLGRTIPQMNIFIIGIPVKIAIAMIMMGVSLPVFSWALEQTTFYMDGQIDVILSALATGR